MISSVISLLVNVALIGGACQLSKGIVLLWLVWKILLVFVRVSKNR